MCQNRGGHQGWVQSIPGDGRGICCCLHAEGPVVFKPPVTAMPLLELQDNPTICQQVSNLEIWAPHCNICKKTYRPLGRGRYIPHAGASYAGEPSGLLQWSIDLVQVLRQCDIIAQEFLHSDEGASLGPCN